MFRVNELIDGKKCNLAIAEFCDVDEALEFCKENNQQPGAHLYVIEIEDLEAAGIE